MRKETEQTTEKELSAQQLYYIENREDICAYQKEYYHNNKELLKSRMLRWKTENREYWNKYQNLKAKERYANLSEEKKEVIREKARLAYHAKKNKNKK